MKRLKTKNIGSSKKRGLLKNRKRIVIASGVTIFCFLLYVAFYEIVTKQNSGNMAAGDNDVYYYANLSQGDPILLQNSFLEDMKKGINNKYTKEKIYFITRRYIDNGGNIYEIYDYVESHPELAFLKEAKAIYPDIFEQIKKRHLPFTYSDQGMYAYLAYVEVLEKYGYADVATVGTAANQYSMMAYYKRMIREDKTKGESLNYPNYTEGDIENDIGKSAFFLTKAKDDVTRILDNRLTSENIATLDILYGVSQYASALRYLDAFDTGFSSPKTSREIFSFATDHSYRFASGMYLTMALSNASTLLLIKSNTDSEIRNALYPFFDFHPAADRSNGIVDRIMRARLVKASVSRYSDLNMYSRKNIVALGNRVPEFKRWLITNGWTENDFIAN